MKKLIPSPSMCVALLALVVACAGSAYAASGGSSGTISACEHHSGALYVTKACGAKGDKRLTLAGAPPTKLFAQIRENGTVQAGTPGIKSEKVEVGTYAVEFPHNVEQCAAIPSDVALPILSQQASDTGSLVGYAPTAWILSPQTSGKPILPGFNLKDTVVVYTYEGSVESDGPFDLAVFC
jgi:hypothetical protein